MTKYELTIGTESAIVSWLGSTIATLTFSEYDGVVTAQLQSLPTLGGPAIGPGSGQAGNVRVAVAEAIADFGVMLLTMAEEISGQ
jgi:hypothetical protein